MLHVSVSGLHISVGRTAFVISQPSEREVPPVANTVPSGSATRVSYERPNAIPAVSRQAGASWFMSITAVRPVTVRFANDGSDQVPDIMTLPGAYITALEASIGLVGPAPTEPVPFVLRIEVERFGPALKTRPSGSRNWNG